MELIIPVILLGAFVGGFLLAAKKFENTFAQLAMGCLFGIGFLLVLVGIAFAGCMILVGSNGFKID